MKKIDNNPFSFESYLLRDAQRITAEICERREHKISNSAVMNVQRSQQLFKESASTTPNQVLKVPRNSTPEEEKLYNALFSSLIDYRDKMRIPLKFSTQNLAKEGSSSTAETDSLGSSAHIERDYPGEIKEDSEDLRRDNLQNQEAEEELQNPDTKEDLQNPGAVEDTLNSETENINKKEDNNKIMDMDTFTPQEEAAIVDDIFKKFGNEPRGESEDGVSKTQSGVKKIKNLDVDSKSNISGSNNIESNQIIPTEILVVLEELPSIMGVDKKVYGPLSPQDVVTIPQPNARILIKNQKGKSIQKYK